MKKSSIATAQDYILKAEERLELRDTTDSDLEKAKEHLEDAIERIESELE